MPTLLPAQQLPSYAHCDDHHHELYTVLLQHVSCSHCRWRLVRGETCTTATSCCIRSRTRLRRPDHSWRHEHSCSSSVRWPIWEPASSAKSCCRPWRSCRRPRTGPRMALSAWTPCSRLRPFDAVDFGSVCYSQLYSVNGMLVLVLTICTSRRGYGTSWHAT